MINPEELEKRKGQQVSNLDALIMARTLKLSVVVTGGYRAWSWPKPAAFIAQQTGEVLHSMFRAGMFTYVKPAPTYKPRRFSKSNEPQKDIRADSSQVADRPRLRYAGDHARAATGKKLHRRQAAASRKAAGKTKKGKVG